MLNIIQLIESTRFMIKEQVWTEDSALAGYEACRLDFPDDENGAVYATLIRRNANSASKKAILYIHGYMDYFFQDHLAEAFIEQGYNFYALDLRKYGRSLEGVQYPNYCKNIQEYFAEISEAIRIITGVEGNDRLILKGHSTGGLTSSLYTAHGKYRESIDGLILNSPFFDMNLRPVPKFFLKIFAGIGTFSPYLSLKSREPVPYMLSIHKDFHGEWDFSLDYRKPEGFPIYAGWLGAILKAHQDVRKGLDIQCPVLLMASDKSIHGRKYKPEHQTGDAILDVKHIREGRQYLGKNVHEVEIKDGLHDLALSRKDVRENFLNEIATWLEKIETL